MPTSLPTRSEYAARRASEQRAARNVLAGGLVLSVIVHFAALQLLEFRIEIQPVDVLTPRTVRIIPEMQAYEVITVAGDVAPIDVQVRERVELPEAVANPTIDAPAAPGTAPATSSTAAPAHSRIEYRMSAPQVWRPAPAVRLSTSAADYARERIAARLEQYNDSMSAEAAAAARAKDWTTTDADGNRWGVTPGKIHLGAVTLPFISEFVPPPGRRDEIAGRIRTWGEIQQQVVRAENKEVIDDRVKAIRARMEAERLRKLQGGG